jgi:hypothetical protein
MRILNSNLNLPASDIAYAEAHLVVWYQIGKPGIAAAQLLRAIDLFKIAIVSSARSKSEKFTQRSNRKITTFEMPVHRQR